MIRRLEPTQTQRSPETDPPRRAVALFSSLMLTTVALGGCGRSSSPPIDVDRATGRACFELYLDDLPPGSQYEDIEDAGDGMLTVRVMTGVDLANISCRLAADGSVTRPD